MEEGFKKKINYIYIYTPHPLLSHPSPTPTTPGSRVCVWGRGALRGGQLHRAARWHCGSQRWVKTWGWREKFCVAYKGKKKNNNSVAKWEFFFFLSLSK